MKLIELKVKSFRSLQGDDISISFKDSDIIFLLGQNNAGKSSLLEAYEFFVSPQKKPSINDFYNFSETNPICIEGIFEKEDGDIEDFTTKGLDRWVDENNQLKFEVRWESIDKKGDKYTYNPETSEYERNGFGGFDSHFTHHAPTPIRVPAMPSEDDLAKWTNDTLKKVALKKLQDDEHEAYLNALEKIKGLQILLTSPEVLSELMSRSNENFQKVFPDLTIDISEKDLTEPDLSKVFDKRFDVSICDTKLPDTQQLITTQGHGVIRQAMFNILGLLQQYDEGLDRKSFLLLFEEPEVYLHPNKIKLLRNSLYELCESSVFQVLCASHSPLLIDISKPHTSLVRIAKNENSVCTHQVGKDVFSTNEERKHRVQMINRFNPHVCEAFFSNEVIIVEGDTEAIVLRELIENVAQEKEIYILNSGSKNNIPFFQEVFTHFNIKHFILHDCDTIYLWAKDKTVKRNKDGTPKSNSAWTLNQTIWALIENANANGRDLARRFVFDENFESAHGYIYDSKKGKPLSAYEYALTLSERDVDQPIVKFLSQLLGSKSFDSDFTPADLELMKKAELDAVASN